MIRDRELRAEFWPRIAQVDRAAWNACFAGEAEDHAYYCACEGARPDGHRMGAVIVRRAGEVIAAAPVFSMTFSLDASFQAGNGSLARLRRQLAGLLGWPLIGIGSPFAERCHIGLRPELDPRDRAAALSALIAGMEDRARSERVRLVAVKDVVGAGAGEVERALTERGYVRLTGLPVAVLDLSGVSSVEHYLGRLSSATRKDIRRKLRDTGPVRIEDRHDIAALGPQLAELYEETRGASGLDYGEFEQLPAEYFTRVSASLGERALFRLYWVGSTLAAFNLLLIERDRIIDKFLGMRYPLAREHNLYALSWVENVRLCIAREVKTLQTGQTAYREKLRLGSQLEPASIYFKHRVAVAHRVLRAFAPLASFERNDPELGALSFRHEA